MTASIFSERFLGRREPAWHGLGKVFDAPIGALEAIESAGLDYEVGKFPLVANVAEPGEGGLDNFQLLQHRHALMRYPTPDDPNFVLFGLVGGSYTLVQNTDIGKVIDPLTELWPVETAGALDAGRTMFLTLNAGSGEVGGEELRNYFLVTDTKDGGTSLRIAFTPVRIVCQNTLVSGIRSATVSATLAHHASVKDDLDFRVSLIAQMQRAMGDTMVRFNTMARAILSVDQLAGVLAVAYPVKGPGAKATLAQELFSGALEFGEYEDAYKDQLQSADWAYQQYIDRVGKYREGAGELLGKFNDEHPALANTAWAVYNAVVETEDYRDGKGQVQRDALFGYRAKVKKQAFAAAFAATNK